MDLYLLFIVLVSRNFVSGICELKPFLQSAISFSQQSDPGEEGTFSRK